MADARAEIETAMRVGVLAALGYKRAEIADKLNLTPQQVRAAMDRVKRATARLDG